MKLFFLAQKFRIHWSKVCRDFGDSLLIVQQVSRKYQCLDGSLNAYLDKCLDVISKFDEFYIHHIYRNKNSRANDLAQQALGYNVSNKNFSIIKKLMLDIVYFLEFLPDLGTETGQTDVAVSLTGLTDAQTGQTNVRTGLTGTSSPDLTSFNPQIDNLAPY